MLSPSLSASPLSVESTPSHTGPPITSPDSFIPISHHTGLQSSYLFKLIATYSTSFIALCTPLNDPLPLAPYLLQKQLKSETTILITIHFLNSVNFSSLFVLASNHCPSSANAICSYLDPIYLLNHPPPTCYPDSLAFLSFYPCISTPIISSRFGIAAPHRTCLTIAPKRLEGGMVNSESSRS